MLTLLFVLNKVFFLDKVSILKEKKFMGCNCKNKGNLETQEIKETTLTKTIFDYILRVILFVVITPFIIPISIGGLFYVLVINKGNLDGFALMKVITRVLQTAFKDDDDDEMKEIIY